MMQFSPLSLPGAYHITLDPRQDHRGCFVRLFCQKEFEEIGLKKPIVNVNFSHTARRGAIRGLHFQYPPDAEVKIAICVKGRVFDVLVDIRKGSPTFLQWVGVELSEKKHEALYIPEGFAHGFQALSDDVEFLYFNTAFYAPQNEGGLHFADPKIGIQFPLECSDISPKDAAHPLISDRVPAFEGVELQ
ncbi:MAG: dTDP-4-dehydrorhamnose 3,5-epimerase [Planctomycetia bacterium]|nr:dTDP-4-dehydrorhamnose 3,5-epimerase [Planctomycetia bacterium]